MPRPQPAGQAGRARAGGRARQPRRQGRDQGRQRHGQTATARSRRRRHHRRRSTARPMNDARATLARRDRHHEAGRQGHDRPSYRGGTSDERPGHARPPPGRRTAALTGSQARPAVPWPPLLRSGRMTRVKICGITSLEDAELAVELGAWALGFILWPGSPRRVRRRAMAAGIARALRRRVELAGVFVNPPLDEVGRAADALGAHARPAARRRGPGLLRRGRPAHRLQGDQGGAGPRPRPTCAALERFHTDLHLLDPARPARRGGTGATWDWELVDERAAERAADPLRRA